MVDKKIIDFIAEHHVLTLATYNGEMVSACSLFYAYEPSLNSFVAASSFDTTHIQNILKNPKIAGNILLETKSVGKVQGLQFRGEMAECVEQDLTNLYFKTFPYARAMMPKLWQIKMEWCKLTDNRLGFGKKLIWP